MSDEFEDEGIITEGATIEAIGDRPIVAPECDVFTISETKVRRAIERGQDPFITSVRIYRTVNGHKARIPGFAEPQHVTCESVLKKYGPGKYEFQGLNDSGKFVASSTLHLEHGYEDDDDDDDDPELPEFPAAAAAPPPPPSTDPMGLLVWMMQTQSAQAHQTNMMLMQALVGGGKRDNGLDQLAQSIAASTAASTQALQGLTTTMAGNFAAQANSPQGQQSQATISMLEKVVLKAMNGQAQPGRDPTELLLLLSQLKGDDDDMSKFWQQMLPEFIDALGLPLMGLIAQALPAEKGAILNGLLQQQLATREAEAKAVDTEGTPA